MIGTTSSKTSGQDNFYSTAVSTLLVLFSIVALLAAIWRMFASDEQMLKRFDGTTLLYLGVAGALLLLRDVKSLAFGDYKVEFERVLQIAENAQDKAEKAENKAENAKTLAIGTGGKPNSEIPMIFNEIAPEENSSVPDDPWKGQFGGASSANNRKLEAQVSRIPGSSNLFTVKLRVLSCLPEQDPLTGVVQFFLHPTFKNDRPFIKVGSSGAAELTLTAWGAFTVGAVADEGKTKLELDLSELTSAPLEFRNR